MRKTDATRQKLLEAAIPHVAFGGWRRATLAAACADTGISETLAYTLCPRGATDLAADYHRQGDAAMISALADTDLSGMRFRDRVAHAVRLRLEQADKEVARRGYVLFSMPWHATEGAQLIWGTADAIWRALGDTSEDANWYTKRATLSAVYGATVLFWLGDSSEDHADSRTFLDRRIDNVMQFEKIKAGARKIPGVGTIADRIGARIRRPKAGAMGDVPGTWRESGESVETGEAVESDESGNGRK